MTLYEIFSTRMNRAEDEDDYIALRTAYCDAISAHNMGEELYADDLDDLCDLFIDICCRRGWPFGEGVL